MDVLDRLRFVALVHDLGKAWSRKKHEVVSIKVLQQVMPPDYRTQKSLS